MKTIKIIFIALSILLGNLFLTSCGKEIKRIGGKIEKMEKNINKIITGKENNTSKYDGEKIEENEKKEELDPIYAKSDLEEADLIPSSISIPEDEDTGFTPSSKNPPKNTSVTKIFLKWINPLLGKTTYRQISKDNGGLGGLEYDGSYFFMDCSSYARYLLKNNGFKYDFLTSDGAFKERIPLTMGNLHKLEPGDLVGWPPTYSNGKKVRQGHVIVYIGEGRFSDVGGSRGTGNAIGFFDVNDIEKKIGKRSMYVKRSEKINNLLMASY